MFFNDVVKVIFDRGASYEAILPSAAHFLCIYIEVWFRILDKHPLGYHFLKVLFGLVVNLLRVFIYPFRKINFRAAYMQERKRVARSHLAGLGGVHYIVGK